MGWLMRTVAVDLATAATRGHRDHLARLVSVLLDPDFDAEKQATDVKLPVTLGGAVGRASHCRLADLLARAGEFWQNPSPGLDASLELEMMDVKTAKQVLETTKAPVGPGGSYLYSIPRMGRLMEQELVASGLGPGSGEYMAFQSDFQVNFLLVGNSSVHTN
jgi:hypothetical protein